MALEIARSPDISYGAAIAIEVFDGKLQVLWRGNAGRNERDCLQQTLKYHGIIIRHPSVI